MRKQLARLPRVTHLAKPFEYMLNHWRSLIRFLDGGPLCLSNTCTERPLRGVATGGRRWLHAVSDPGGQSAAAIYTPIIPKIDRIGIPAWIADVVRIADHPARRMDERLPWTWRKATTSPLKQAV